MGNAKQYKIVKSDQDWQEELSAEQYRILRKKGTERPFTGEYDHFFDKGYYLCAGCGQKLFTSESKFDSGCGWPAFDREIEKGTVEYEEVKERLNMKKIMHLACAEQKFYAVTVVVI